MDKDQFRSETAEEVPTSGSLQTSTASSKPSFVRRLRNHYKKWWWAHLLVLITIVLVVTLPLVYVAFPRIAQSNVNKATISVQEQVVSDPTPSSVRLHLVTANHNPSSHHPTLDGFKAALFLRDAESHARPFGYIDIPKMKASSTAYVTVDQVMEIGDMDQFIAYNKLVVNSNEYSIGMSGRTGLHEMAFPTTHVNLNKTLTMKGLNKLEGFNISSFKILLQPDPDGANMVGNVHIPNPSVMTVSMGNITTNLFVDGQLIGTSLLPDLMLRPGGNTVPMRSTTNQSAVIKLVMSKYRNGVLPIDIVANSSINSNGQHLPYFEEALKENTLHVSLDVKSALAQIGLNLTSV